MLARIGIAAIALMTLGAGLADAACGAHACKCARAYRTVEKLICEDTALSAVDMRLDRLYAAASTREAKEPGSRLAADQRKWENLRNNCWKSPDMKACIVRSYETRMAELVATYGLSQASGHSTFSCDGQKDLVVTYFPTTPPSARVERGDEKKVLLVASSETTQYAGGNATFWEKDGEARVTWEGQEGSCTRTAGPEASQDAEAATASDAPATGAATASAAATATAPAQ